MSPQFEREHYRIQYPTAARPSIVIDGQAHEVIDLSERGVRFRAGDTTITVGDELSGRLRFRQGEPIDVKGTVLRIVAREIAVRLEVGVPLKVIIEEQRYLRERHRGMAW
jgi:PilZ domain-containing protein